MIEIPIVIDALVEFDYQPYEPPERGPEARYPGCQESAEVCRVLVGKVDITKEIEPSRLVDIAAAILEARE